MKNKGAWGAQSVEHLSRDLGTGPKLTDCDIEPSVRPELTWDSPFHACTLSLQINQHLKN